MGFLPSPLDVSFLRSAVASFSTSGSGLGVGGILVIFGLVMAVLLVVAIFLVVAKRAKAEDLRKNGMRIIATV